MNQYLNKRTGAQILTECDLDGEDWVKIDPPKEEAPKEEAPKKSTRRVRK